MTSDADVVHNRNADPICIKVLKAKNLRGSRGENVAFVIKVEFADRLLSESSKFDTNGDSQLDCNFTSFLNCPSDDVVALDELANKPLVFTVSEVLQKEKKQKEEKTSLLGQCCLDLSPFLRGTTHIKQTLTLCPFSGSPLENLFQENQKAELDVNVTLNQPLVTDAHFKGSNILTISLGSLYSPPESWTTMSQSYHYGASLPIPITPERENSVVFTNGLLKPAQDKDANNKQKKWANPGTASGNAAYLPTSIFSIPIEEEDGDLKGKEDVDHRNIAENDRHRVIWNMERRCFLDSSTIKVFQESIAKCRYWPLEIMRMSQPAVGKGKKDEDVSVGFHGITFLNLAPLLYPGVQTIRGAFKVIGYSDHLLAEKTKRKAGLLDETVKATQSSMNRLANSPVQKKGGKDGDKRDKKQAAKSEADSESQASINVEGQQYNEAKSYIMVELSLDKPLVPKRPAELLAKRVAELIPPRPMFAKRTDGAQKAVEDFHFQVASVANLILEEFREHFGDQFKDNEPQSSEDMEARRQKLVYELNSSGKYFAFKEQLKHSVVKIVREKYLRTTGFEDRQELQTFLSELYVYLIDQMHVSLGHVMAHEDQPPVPKPLTDNAQLKHFAQEAEVNQNFQLAATFYKERIARDKTDANSWFDFGTFNLYIHDIPKAEECFKECISLNPSHLQGLMLYGVVCMMTERYDLAETFFESATCVEPKSVLAWTMLGLFYDAVPNEISAEMAFIEAQKLNLMPEVEPKEEEPQEESFDEDKGKTPDPQEEKSSPMSEVLKTESVKTFEDKTPDPTKTSVTGADKLVADDGNELGSAVKVCVLSSTAENVIEIESSTTPQPPESIYMQAVEWLLEVKATSFTERALGHELVTCPNGPTPAYYIALAQLRLQKGEYNLAEESLNEALQLDFQSPDAWSLMGHVKYMTNDFNGARDCYERTVSFIEDARDMHSTYLRLASIYLQENKYETAKRTFLLACKRSPSCVSWLGVGIACYRLNELTEAEDALSEANILNNNDPEVWAYLSLICLKTKRQLEAEQAYKYAIKLSLDDPALLAEIHREQVIHGFGNPAF
ncbi:cilia- and flagella-associated protein 70-like isoform X2 [Biomphalaria glabrata]|uniref:Cilia- and flagella-associated protein 70-like isoform X2 n=1 Tax=Biomphalaria glabrata TaxID=6526 RepID=A0A9W3A1B0_BIOGL|nr:cilia- and flagella-associated protein 70-like isoform X2 [Biomphalaria glabrata]